MNLERPLVALLGAGIVVLAVGALVTLASQTLSGDLTTPAAAVVALVALSLVAGVGLGFKNSEWVRNPGYW
ncbi:hypothetical protein [Halosegnis marinus]|uniref:Uncharacterized protein n=1 Tax=Halosegnis marinus TaxID=3034023 RepID=A0ABD5ZS92_9EURY|nr:hypothetical protein [Halosegnis sp. DT85]